jgi:imidazolonepropionase-like amidohydrolase
VTNHRIASARRSARSSLAIAVAVAAGGAIAAWLRAVAHRFVEGSESALRDLVVEPLPQHLVFRDVATWDGVSDHLRSHTSVEVRDGEVVAVRDAIKPLPDGAVVVEGEGLTLMPGLIDMHVHMMYESGPDLLTRAPKLMRGWMKVVMRYPEGRDDIVRRGQLKLKAGVTTIRILGDGYYALAYRDDVAAWDVVGPRVFAAGLHVNGPDGYVTGGIAAGLEPALRAEAAVELRSFDEIEPLLERHIARGIDVVKICTTHGDLGFSDARPDLPEAWVRRIVEVAHTHGLKVTAHSYGDEGDWAAIRGGVDGIEHLVNVPHALANDMIAAIRKRGIVVCPTLAGSSYSVMRFLRAPELLYKDPDLVDNVSAKVRRNLYLTLRVLSIPGVARVLLRKSRPMERWESWYRHSLANTRALYEAGVPLVFGTDTPFVFGNFHHTALGEMRALREAELPNLEILKMATSHAADVLGMSDKIGTVKPGMVADLLLINGNPLIDLEALGSIEMVMKEGRVVYAPSTPAASSTHRAGAIGGVR